MKDSGFFHQFNISHAFNKQIPIVATSSESKSANLKVGRHAKRVRINTIIKPPPRPIAHDSKAASLLRAPSQKDPNAMHEIPQLTIPITLIVATSSNHVNHPKSAFFHACQFSFVLGSHHDGDLGNSSSNRVVNLVHIYVPAHHGHGHSSIRRFRL